MTEEESAQLYALRLGERLRAIRRQQRLTLHAVQHETNGEFRASILGSYERGARAISVPRLQRLAQFYNVPVDQLLPGDAADRRASQGDPSVGQGARGKLTVDLVQLARTETPVKSVLAPYVRGVQRQRQDFTGRVITLRDDDVRVIAGVLSLTIEQLRQQLEQHGIAR